VSEGEVLEYYIVLSFCKKLIEIDPNLFLCNIIQNIESVFDDVEDEITQDLNNEQVIVDSDSRNDLKNYSSVMANKKQNSSDILLKQVYKKLGGKFINLFSNFVEN